ncbi:MAG TPA: 4-hydroxy-3-methylbut-2-enyl diphosphate reductase, partial [Feifaniaceae bacterium]|nr:4-hydroxy-3-methylbut-2-enyl diphosphate reductase [Feifaniaceae bacterium]
MRVLLAKNSGFCFGVRRAVEMAEALAGERGSVYTYGN